MLWCHWRGLFWWQSGVVQGAVLVAEFLAVLVPVQGLCCGASAGGCFGGRVGSGVGASAGAILVAKLVGVLWCQCRGLFW